MENKLMSHCFPIWGGLRTKQNSREQSEVYKKAVFVLKAFIRAATFSKAFRRVKAFGRRAGQGLRSIVPRFSNRSFLL